ncbi:MAG TPA: hypothetical protein VG826_33075 [Pirellulales bacterium]|nr:hypothetical protein [Pirellulales bacterium]
MKRNGKALSLLVIVSALGAAQAFRFAVARAADTAFSADMKGWGAFLRGAGSFNLNTAKAAQINSDALMRWKQDVRAAAAEQRWLQAQREAGARQQIEEARYRLAMREYQLRVNPTPADIQNGLALNLLVDDLMDPDILTSDWVTKAVPLPEGMSVKDLIFGFVPASGASKASKKLSRGVIALSRLDVKGEKWPTVLKDHALDAERAAYEAAYAKLRDELVSDTFDHKTLIAFDKSLSALAEKVKTAIPNTRGFRGEAQKYVTELRAATRMFDAETVDYAKEILIDTQNQDAHTVTELVSFMLKYRLRFETAERSPISRVAYDQVYKAMRQQADVFGIKPPDPPAAPGANDRFPVKIPDTDRARSSIDLLKLVDPARDTVKGQWQLEGGCLLSGPGLQSRVHMPQDVPEHYRFTVSVAHGAPGPGRAITLGLPFGKAYAMLAIDDTIDPHAGFHLLDGKGFDMNESRVSIPAQANGAATTVACTVSPQRIVVELDGKRIIDWGEGGGRFTIEDRWAPRDRAKLFVGSDLAARFSKLELESLEPGAKVAAPAPAASDPASRFTLNSVWTDGVITVTVTERKPATFRATWKNTKTNVHRIVSGAVRGNQISWLAKDAHVTNGDQGFDWFGTIDHGKIDFTVRNPNGAMARHTTTLKLKE